MSQLGSNQLIAGALTVDIAAHQIGVGPCWTYVTRGLAARGQREIALTLCALPSDDVNQPPADPLHFFKMVYDLAGQGQLVSEDGFTGFGGAGMLGARGLAYGTAVAMPEVGVTANALCAITLTGAEAELANALGTMRVLTRLGQATRHFPHPFWCDRRRESVAQSEEQTILSSLALARSPGATAMLANNVVTLRLQRSAAPTFAPLAQLPADASVGFAASIDPQADGLLVWQPGQQAPTAIQASAGPDGQVAQQSDMRMGGSFVLFAPQQPHVAGQLFEDGFAFFVTDQAWQQVRQAVLSGQPTLLAGAPGAFSFRLEWA